MRKGKKRSKRRKLRNKYIHRVEGVTPQRRVDKGRRYGKENVFLTERVCKIDQWRQRRRGKKKTTIIKQNVIERSLRKKKKNLV